MLVWNKKHKTTHSKNISQTGSFPQGSGVKIKQGTIPNPTYGTKTHTRVLNHLQGPEMILLTTPQLNKYAQPRRGFHSIPRSFNLAPPFSTTDDEISRSKVATSDEEMQTKGFFGTLGDLSL